MGYILPIQHIDYNEYHKRLINSRESPYYIEQPYKIIFKLNQQEIKKKQKLPENHFYKEKLHFKKGKEENKQAKWYTKITGVGGKINKMV